MWSENFFFWTEESINALWSIIDCTLFGIDRTLFASDTSTLGLIKYEGSCAGKLMRFTIYTIVELITNGRILVIEETIGAIAQGINANFGFLDIFAVLTFYVEWIVTFFLVGVASFKKKSIRA